MAIGTSFYVWTCFIYMRIYTLIYVLCLSVFQSKFFIFVFLKTLFLLLTLLTHVPIFLPFAHPHLAPARFPSGHHRTVFCICGSCLCFLAGHSISFHPVPHPLPSDSCQSVPCVHASVSILFVSLFCSLDSTYEWDHMYLSFSDWLISPICTS